MDCSCQPTSDAALFGEFAQLAAQRIGLRIPDEAHDRFIGILHEHARRHGYTALQDYQHFLANHRATGEWEELAVALTSGETFFFRDHGQFDLLRQRLLPELIARHRGDKTLRLWSAGCASGEEAYSLAILVDMLLPERCDWNILILGTDIDSGAIAKAQRGRYGQWSFRMVPPEIQQRYFRLEDNEWMLDERIRRMVTFRISNLVAGPFPDRCDPDLHDPDPYDMDMILCRNVFIYFNSAALTAVATKLAAALREGGYLLTAHTELTGHPVRALKSKLFAEGVVYQRSTRAPGFHSDATALPPPQPSPASGGGGDCGESWDGGDGGSLACPELVEGGWGPAGKEEDSNAALLRQARAHADRGEFDLAEQVCHAALAANSLAAPPYFLLAQLAQARGDFNQARECLNKAIYLDPRFVAAHLEQAALYERAGDISRAQALRRTALNIARSMPSDEMVEQCETTAGNLAQWLLQREREIT